MGRHSAARGGSRWIVVAVAVAVALIWRAPAANAQAGDDPPAAAQAANPPAPTLDIYGFAQADAIVDSKQVNPDWMDAFRPSRLPSYPNQYGNDGNFSLSVKQSRFGVKGNTPTSFGDVKGQFEFDLFGVGADAGQTTIRFRHVWGQWKQIGAGQTNSQFMDIDVFPNSIDYWGPNGMLFFRNVQIFWEPYAKGDSNVRVAIERPGASGDAGVLADRVELQSIKPRFPSPDFTGHYRYGQKWGYVQIGGALRYIAWDDLLPNDQFNLNGHVWGWGFAASSGLNVTPKDRLHLQVVYGHAVENYFNDAPTDVGAQTNPGNTVTPVTGKALPDLGLVIFLDHTWSDKWTTSAGWSMVQIDNSNLQTASEYHRGQYALVNLLCTPTTGVMVGGELLYGRRDNNSDGFHSDDVRFQFSVKFNFGYHLGGQ